jgi:anti-anti-sigma regulatory factor
LPVLRLDASAIDTPDVGTVGALARAALLARRAGCELRLEGASEDLRALLTLCGLAEALPCSGVEAGR